MKKFSVFSFAIFATTIATCISCGYLLSNVLISTNIFQFSSTVVSEAKTYYALSTNSASTKSELATDSKTTLQSQNGAGVIYEKDEKFFLLASIYENLPDAEKVKTNLKAQDIKTEIIKIELSSTSVDGNFSNEEKNILATCLKSKFEIFESLYDVAISLDTQVFDMKKAKLECNNIFSKHIERKANLETFFKDDSKTTATLKTELENISTHLSNLISENYETSNQTFSSLIKTTYCKILLDVS